MSLRFIVIEGPKLEADCCDAFQTREAAERMALEKAEGDWCKYTVVEMLCSFGPVQKTEIEKETYRLDEG